MPKKETLLKYKTVPYPQSNRAVVTSAIMDHGALSGLADDDHTQYAGIAQTEAISGAWTHSADVTFSTGVGIIHDDGVTAGYILRANGTRYIPAQLDIDDLATNIADEQYVVMTLTSDLANERVLTAGDGIDLTDGGAGSTATVAVDVTDILGSGLTESSNNIDLSWGTPTIGTIECDDSANAGTSTNPARSDHQHAIVCAAPGTNLSSSSTNAEGSASSFARSDHSHAITGLGAIPNAQFVTLALSSDLGVERVLTAGDGIDVTDAGANSTVTVAVDVTDILGSGLTESSNNIDLAWGTPTIGTIQCDATANAGTSTNPARSDHRHAIVCAAPTTNLSSSSTNAEGSATSFARSDHTHAVDGLATNITDEQYVVMSLSGDLSAERVLTAGDGLDLADGGANSTATLTVDVTDLLGSGLTESSNNIDLNWGTPTIGTIECDDSASAGTSTNPARSDHQHAIVCAAPTTNLSSSSTNAEGSANSFARSDHTHAVDGITNISGAQYVVMALSGDLSAERVLTAGDGLDLADGGANGNATLTVDVTDILGSGLTESSNNIDLNWGTPTIGTIECDDSASAGSSTNPARSDHQHAIVCAAPTAILHADSTNSEGSASSFARSDHGHDLGVGAPNFTFDTSNSEGDATYFIRRNATIALFDATVPATLTVSTSAATGSAGKAARRDHAHAITTSSNPGAAASILASSAAGKLTLVDLALTSLTASTVIYSDASKEITSLANGTGFLYNNGSGTLSYNNAPFSWVMEAAYPTAISANTNDYNPGTLATLLCLTCSGGSYNITGLTGGTEGMFRYIFNTDATYALTLTHDDSSSSAANRFLNVEATDTVLGPYDAATYVYISSRWRQLAWA